MNNMLNKITTGEGAKFKLLLLLSLISSIGFGGCTGSFNIGNSNSETTNKVEDNRKTNSNSTGNSVGNTESSNTSNADTAEKPVENVEKPFASNGELPSDAQLRAMTEETLLNFNDAVQKGDFTDFHDTISDVWKKTATPDAFNNGFKEFIDKKIDISTIKDSTAKFDPQPAVTKKDKYLVLMTKGTYDTSPLPVRFETEYIEQEGDWKLISIRVDTRK